MWRFGIRQIRRLSAVLASLILLHSAKAEEVNCSISDHLKYGATEIVDNERKFALRGSAWVCVRGILIEAEEIRLDGSSRLAQARGTVSMREPRGTITRAERLTLIESFSKILAERGELHRN